LSLSDTANTNYIKVPYTSFPNLSAANSWKLEFDGIVPVSESLGAKSQFIWAGGQYNNTGDFPISISKANQNNYLFTYLQLDIDGTITSTSLSYCNYYPNKGKKFHYELEYTGTAYTWSVTIDNEVISSYTLESSYKVADNTADFKLSDYYLKNESTSLSDITECSLDLNSVKFYIDGDLVYRPCLKIPYTESKTGAKVVQAAYRDRVEDVYEQFGTGNYYTIDEQNENFTLPYPDLYGLIESNSAKIEENSETISGIQNNYIGVPVPRLDDSLPDGYIRLEGAEVSRTTYAKLFELYGTTYGEGDGSTTFKLPDLTGRVLWGATDLGYIAAGLPNITGNLPAGNCTSNNFSGAFYDSGTATDGYNGGSYYFNTAGFNASRSNSIYGNSDTVQPPAVKVRWITRYE